ncbi:MAG: uroporphyrinogen decarboxylase family protein [Actinomycetes bacterium]
MSIAPQMTSAERVLCALSGKEPDRVPFFLPVTMHGALEMGVPLDEYYQSARLLAEGQLRLRAKYRDDIVYPFFYGAIDVQAFGGEVEFYADGPPNSVDPLLSDPQQISNLSPPVVADCEPLRRVLDATEILSTAIAGEALTVGVIMSPFSLPVMQLGFEQYLNLLYEQPELARQLHAVNEAFAVSWANAQLAAGANAIGYFDPVSSPTVLSGEMFTEFGLPMMRRTLAAINGPCAALLASGLCEPLIDDLVSTNAVIVGASSDEDLAQVKATAAGRMTVMGNLNGIEMRRWTADQAREEVRDAIAAGAPGGGFILSDTHGEIPIQVPEDVLLTICDAVREFGSYPIDIPNPDE